MFWTFESLGIENNSFFKYEEWTDVICPMHCSDTVEVVIVLGGELIVKKENTEYILKEDEMILIMPFERHEFITEKNSKMIVLEAASAFFPEFGNEMKNKTLKNPCCIITETEKNFIWEHLERTHKNFFVEVRCIFYFLFSKFTDNSEFTYFKTPDNLFKEVILYTKEHFEENINLKEVASELGVSPVYLSRMFSRKFGTKFNEFLNSFRVKKAMYLLAATSLSMSEICYSCGWGNIRSFNNCIQKSLGCTPTDFRKKKRTEGELKILTKII